ncbi:MAG: flavodoxin family protein [Lachnospiraceae bacterium]|nr:flavodoxin family protein [Lachnospiraceae bacterium]
MSSEKRMRIVNVNGSPHAEIGNTHALLKRFIEKINSEGYEVELTNHFLVKEKIEGCRGCTRCMRRGVCVLESKDDVKAIIDDMKNADIVVYSTPIFVMHVTGYMKRYLDRTAYVTHRMLLEGKRGFYVLASQGLGIDETSAYVRHVMEAMGVDVMGSVLGTAIVHGQFLNDEEIDKSIDALIEEIKTGAAAKEKCRSEDNAIRNKFNLLLEQEDISKKLFGADYKYWKEREASKNG